MLRALGGMICEHLLWCRTLGQKRQDFCRRGACNGLTTHQRELQDCRQPCPKGLEALSQFLGDVECHVCHSSLLVNVVAWEKAAISRGVVIVIAQQAPKALATPDLTAAALKAWLWGNELVQPPLMITLGVIMGQVLLEDIRQG